MAGAAYSFCSPSLDSKSRYEDTLDLTRDTGWLLGFGSGGQQSADGAFGVSWLLAVVDFSMAFCIRKICPSWSQSAETLGLLAAFLAPLAELLGLTSTFSTSLTDDVLGSVMFSGAAGVTWFFLFTMLRNGESGSSIMRRSSSESMFTEECLTRLAGVHSADSSTLEHKGSSSDTEFKVVSALSSTELSFTLALAASSCASSFAGVESTDITSLGVEACSVNVCKVLPWSNSSLGFDNPNDSLLVGA